MPFVRGDQSRAAASAAAMLFGAVLPQPRGLPLGTGLDLSTDEFEVVPGGTSHLTLSVTAPRRHALRHASVRVSLPDGWSGRRVLHLGDVRRGHSVTRTVAVTAPADVSPTGRSLVGATLRSGGRTGFTDQQLQVVPVVAGTQQRLPQVVAFDSWAAEHGVDQLTGTVKPVLTLPSGGSRTVTVDVTNNGDATESGEVTLDLPDGFTGDGAAAYSGLAPGATQHVDVQVSNTDDSLPTSNEGGTDGDYDYTITTTSTSGTSTADAALELVPATAVEDGAAPTLDGTVGDGEYSATIDISRRWEGDACENASDCSGTAYLQRSGDDLYVAVDVTDDTLGTVLDPADCKRHWRVDSVEIALDPAGTSENTSTTFKTGVLPTTTAGVACAERDADNRQGPIGTFRQVGGDGTPAADPQTTAPGFDLVSRLKEPYTGYVVEMKIPMSALPETVDPDHLGFNAFVYDSDTQDKTGQTRLGWSTWGGVQGDPYRWGRVTLGGDAPPEVPTSEPLLDFPALESVSSPQSVAQAVRTRVAVSGLPKAPVRSTAWVRSARSVPGAVLATLRVNGPGTAHVFAADGADGAHVVGTVVRDLRPGVRTVRVPLEDGAVPDRVLVGFEPAAGSESGTTSSAVRVR